MNRAKDLPKQKNSLKQRSPNRFMLSLVRPVERSPTFTMFSQSNSAARQNNSFASSSSAAKPAHLREQAREDRRRRTFIRRFKSREYWDHLGRRYVRGTLKGLKVGRRFGFKFDDGIAWALAAWSRGSQTTTKNSKGNRTNKNGKGKT